MGTGGEKEVSEMKRRIRIGAASLAVAAGLIGAVAAPASAGPQTTKPAEVRCALDRINGGGSFELAPDGSGYGCAMGAVVADPQVSTAKKLCENAYKGVFTYTHTHTILLDVYTCAFGA